MAILIKAMELVKSIKINVKITKKIKTIIRTMEIVMIK